MIGQRIVNNILGNKPKADRKSKNSGQVWTKQELEEIMMDRFPAFNEDEKRVFLENWLGQPKG